MKSVGSRLPQLGKSGQAAAWEGEKADGSADDNTSNLKSASVRLEKWHKMTDVGKKVLSLDLANLNLGQNAAVSIAELYNRQKTNVKHITLQDNPNFGSESLKYVLMCLDNQCALTSINLRNIGLTNQCVSLMIKAFYQLPQLSSVNLAHNHLNEEGISLFSAFLKTNSTITNLSLAHNKLKDAGAEELAKSLEFNTSLQQLDLNTCRIADAGAIHIGLMLANNVGLTSLDLNKNPVTEDGVNAFAEVIQRNTGLIQISLSGVEKMHLERIAKITRRNKSFVGELVPYKLDREMQRLYVQQHKLEVANQQLHDLHAETARIQDQAKNIDAEFEMERQDINQRAKKVVEIMDFTSLTIQELQRKYKDLEAGGAREKEAKEQEIQTLTNKLDDTTRDREQLEQRAQKIQEEYNAKTESRDGKAKEIQDKIDATVAETQALNAQFAETQAKIAEISQKMQELEAGGEA
jgi:predicted  nucleic acid-binding Zn-ribbon protein|uniref:Uncharacterized protein n=1 Tax=Eutreptiella gymnastica TaxID=73025 RepID=A0A7S4GHW1_9EUGL|mmetsp:Transcript_52283/g.87267  ORF Transcript_52283/g.87267 Transcript_52283/m.87267 type:complete len:465 (-) Transcript_52283:2023-3417(-)|eukprot:CAMPEP_0174281970 /NCGR_PEP_ID=MMETSP0809-20121228/2413_1 /TAXON_ID=73025 ORGANISM="Eutreptiella gymnastica-like, Strain CCMP1594" /NCGR_SAMPLE_ID=MMETSP0809 /ASSEMBLY_ACC=CAM_ASM_000658 /LENGTH=464 /DNA_ID=CAMNT_0015375873 /DNA_START=154 /DNA_END=1548 /DNA_ORIENTATION=+